MIKILLVNVSLSRRKFARGGASKSFSNIIHGFAQIPNFKLYNLDLKVSKKTKQIFDRIPIGYYIFIPKIIHSIKKFKPDVILTQTRISFATIISAKITNTLIVNFVRDLSDFCPKFIDIIAYGKSCPRLINMKTCYNCIDKWSRLRVEIGNKPKYWAGSFASEISKISYKLRYFICKLNINLLKWANMNVVASNLIKYFFMEYVNSDRFKKAVITPIKSLNLEHGIRKEKKFLFVRPNYDASHKGLDFVQKLSKLIPKNYQIVIAGSKSKKKEINSNFKNVRNLGYLEKTNLQMTYRSSIATLLPSFCTEAFGRVAVESIINGTPVIASCNCGVNEYLKNKPYFFVVPINLKLWKETLLKIIENPPNINLNEREKISELFSIESCIQDIILTIKSILKNNLIDLGNC